jgi:hypothetical protein
MGKTPQEGQGPPRTVEPMMMMMMMKNTSMKLATKGDRNI